MVSIKDLGKPVQPPELAPNATRLAAKTESLGAVAIKHARVVRVRSYSVPPTLGLSSAPVHELTGETPHIVRMMQELAAKAEREEQAATRPQWKRWRFWASLIGGAGALISFTLGVLTYWKSYGM